MLLNNFYLGLVQSTYNNDNCTPPHVDHKGVSRTMSGGGAGMKALVRVYTEIPYDSERVVTENLNNYTIMNYNSPSDYIVLGSGNTPVTFKDYKLDELITSEALWRASTAKRLMSTSNAEGITGVIITGNFENRGDSPITVREVGLYRSMDVGSSKSFTNLQDSAVGYAILDYREVLETPVVFEAGEVKSITIQIRFDGGSL